MGKVFGAPRRAYGGILSGLVRNGVIKGVERHLVGWRARAMALVKGLRMKRGRPTLGAEQGKTRYFAERGWRFKRIPGGWEASKGALKCGPRPCMRSLLNRVSVAEMTGRGV